MHAMNQADPAHHWWPIATSAELSASRPLARILLGLPLALYRDAQGHAVAQVDRCPHRHAPLSQGCVRNGELQCPYHGWRFDSQGRRTCVPGLETQRTTTKPLNQVIATLEQCGLVWAHLAPQADSPAPTLPTQRQEGLDVFFMTSVTKCELAAAAENFLDGFHTHFVHAGWVRLDKHRQKVHAQVRHLADGVEVTYSGEGLQAGLLSRLLESRRSQSFGRFRLPGLAEIEYQDLRGLSLLASVWLTPERPGQLRVHVRIATRRGWLPAWFKTLVLRRLFGVVLRQDQGILEQTAANGQRFAQIEPNLPQHLDSPLDLLAPHIRKLLAGQPPPHATETLPPIKLYL
jgi:phenylpropionate dioxygenase-like ring-hydroxylating dioxygenase large terminal subunit